jgi:hypothetical protein
MELSSEIQNAIKKNMLVIFAGSGLSKRFNLPDWPKLVEDIISGIDNENYNGFLKLLNGNIMRPLEILEHLKPEKPRIKKYILNNFNISKGDFTLHEKLLSLSGQIITTNYDNAFERASNEKINASVPTSRFNISEINKSDKPYIFKIHGTYQEPDNCIVFKEDYENVYNKDSAAQEKLKAIFAEKTILFVGFSFSDSDINTLFNNLDQVFDNNNKHYILTKEPKDFQNFKFLTPIPISDYGEVDIFIDECLKYKSSHSGKQIRLEVASVGPVRNAPKIALLYPNPIDINLREDFLKVVSCFDSMNASIFTGSLNLRTLGLVQDFDLLVIVSKVYKSKLYIENDNLKSDVISPVEICEVIPNDDMPIIFITNEKIEDINEYPVVNISTLKHSSINRFLYKAIKNKFDEIPNDEIFISPRASLKEIFLKGEAKTSSIYNIKRDLEIGKKSLNGIVGRIEEQANIALKLLGIRKTNKLLNIKASGGTGKTVLIKKVAYELYNRGYFSEGVNFMSCEQIKTYGDLEELVVAGFNLTNILNFKEYLSENFRYAKKDLLIILDNFETVVNSLDKNDISRAIDLLKYATDYANVVITSREKLTLSDDFEDVYSLSSLVTDDAVTLFLNCYGSITSDKEIEILRSEILEELLNNNPLAIKLVTKSRPRFKHISELRDQLKEHFFESTNEDYTMVFRDNVDLNIERKKSIYQSINYSYRTLNHKEKLAFELLNLFPDGISLVNFKKCFEKKTSSNQINDNELRLLRDKSLIEDYNGVLQLQPIIRRFAEFQFAKRSSEIKQKYCLDAYSFNCFIQDIIKFVDKKETKSFALKIYSLYKNNLLNVLSYISEIKISENGPVRNKKFFLNYIWILDDFIVSTKQVEEFHQKVEQLKPFFSDVPNAELLICVLDYNNSYYQIEFEESFKKMSELLSVEQMEGRDFAKEDYIENRYKDIISNVLSMEGYTLQRINAHVKNDDISWYLDAHLFYLGITDNIGRNKDGFYYFEYELMFQRLDEVRLRRYIDSIHPDYHLEKMQCTYTLSKVKPVDIKTILKLVVTNPYTGGLQELMMAFNVESTIEKERHFKNALMNLSHIKYYYLECLYYYCLFLKRNNLSGYHDKVSEGIQLSAKFYYQYLNFLFKNIENNGDNHYSFSYAYYPIPMLEEYVKKHNARWEIEFKEDELSNKR